MEGFLLKRRAKGRLFRSENWSSHWYVLEGATLAEYKGFDTATSKPLGAPRLVPVARCRVAPNEALRPNPMKHFPHPALERPTSMSFRLI